MDAQKPFKVIVVGGGVAGLTLANMLQQFDIDFVVLEAYHDVAPAVGASIGLFPNGLRILDQIGVFERVAAMSQEPLVYGNVRDSSGKLVSTLTHVQEHIRRRFGYPMLFFDRQWLLKALYDQLKDQNRVILNKKVGRIEHIAGGVRLKTLDGEIFDGSIAVGADGIHSSVRKEMNRMAQEAHSSAFPPNQDDEIPCYYKCSFGIAQNVVGWPQQDQSFVMGAGHSALISAGPENRVYWFIFVRLPEIQHGKSIPKYTKEDDEQFSKEYADMPITETLRFGDIYEKKLSSTLTPLHEMVYKTWFFKRVVLLGDSAHKPNPIDGQGGNGAIESAAELINALIEARDIHRHGLETMHDDDITRIFAQMQSARDKRARTLVEKSHQRQALMASENPLRTTLTTWAMALLPSSHWSISNISASVVGSAKIKYIPVPFRPRAIPFEDERPASPVKPETSKIIRFIYAGAMLSSSVLAGVSSPSWPASGGMGSLWQHVAPLLMYTIEGHRVGHQGSVLGVPSVMALGLRGLGTSRIIPAYAFLHACLVFDTPPERYIPTPAAKSILQAFAVSGLVASATYMLGRYKSAPSDPLTALWETSALFPVLVWGLTKFSGGGQETGRPKSRDRVDEPVAFDQYKPHDMSYLRAIYACAFGVQAVAHVASGAPLFVGQALLGFLRDTATTPSVLLASPLTLPSGQGLACAAWVLGNLYAIWDLRRLGYVKTSAALKAVVGVALGQILVGPGATWAGLWFWRDDVFVGSMMN
ncbi:FAD binding domain protein [Apiospora arundinis]|uniref:FAD binding domain protein n=1 Tax=Apiospora arundinis TaxID=335852 RepID=A0ABR2IX90_9PEZI